MFSYEIVFDMFDTKRHMNENPVAVIAIEFKAVEW